MTDCDNYRSWYKKTFKKDLDIPKKKRKKDKREEIREREEQIAGKTEAYSIIAQAMSAKTAVKITKRRGRPPGNKHKTQS
jgi:hypothetical protein